MRNSFENAFLRCQISNGKVTLKDSTFIASPILEILDVILVVGWRIGLTQRRTATEVKHGRARSGVGWVTAQVINQ